MSEKIKNYLGVTIMLALFIAAVSVISFANSYSRSISPSSFRSFSASAEGKVVAIPDVAQFTFSVITQGGKDIAVVQKENTEKVNKIIDFVKSNSIADKDIKTQSYNLSPRYTSCAIRYSGEICPPPEIVGYNITQSVEVKIRDFSKIGVLLSGVVENGANSVSQLYFNIDDPTELQNQARAEAIVKAKEKAKVVAKAGGFRLGKLLSIEEGYYYQPIYKVQTFEATMGAPIPAPAPAIEPGSQDVTVNVTLRYEIK